MPGITGSTPEKPGVPLSLGFSPIQEQACKDYIYRCQNEDFEGLLLCHGQDGSILGVANLSQIFYRTFQNAYLGYYVDVNWARQGLMLEGIGLVLEYAFYPGGLGIAGLMPSLERSEKWELGWKFG